MGYSIGEDTSRGRFIGYGVPTVCEHPDCNEEIDRGVSYACNFWYDQGCGLFFCPKHLHYTEEHEHPVCERCRDKKDPFDQKDDTLEWMQWMLSDESWEEWRSKNKEKVEQMKTKINLQIQ